MSHHESGKSDLSIGGLFVCISAAMTAIGLFLMAAHSIEEPTQTAKVFVPATLSQSTLPK